MIQDAIGNNDRVLWWCQWLLQVQFTFVYDNLYPLTTKKLWVTRPKLHYHGPKRKVTLARVRDLRMVN